MVTRYQKFVTKIHGAHSVENLPLPLFESMRDFDIEEAEAKRIAAENAREEVD